MLWPRSWGFWRWVLTASESMADVICWTAALLLEFLRLPVRSVCRRREKIRQRLEKKHMQAVNADSLISTSPVDFILDFVDVFNRFLLFFFYKKTKKKTTTQSSLKLYTNMDFPNCFVTPSSQCSSLSQSTKETEAIVKGHCTRSQHSCLLWIMTIKTIKQYRASV